MATSRVEVGAELPARWFESRRLIYGGMPSDRSFSIVVKETIGVSGWAYPLYFPADQMEFQIAKTRFRVLTLSTAHIELEKIE